MESPIPPSARPAEQLADPAAAVTAPGPERELTPAPFYPPGGDTEGALALISVLSVQRD